MSFPTSLAMRLRAAYLNLHRSANRHFANYGMTADQYAVLTCLAEWEGLTQQELVRHCASDKRTVGKMLDLLEKKGFIERRAHPTDRRAWTLFLTPEGIQKQQEIYPSAEYLRRRLQEAVPPEHLEVVLSCLENMASQLDPEKLRDVIDANKPRSTRAVP